MIHWESALIISLYLTLSIAFDTHSVLQKAEMLPKKNISDVSGIDNEKRQSLPVARIFLEKLCAAIAEEVYVP